MPSLALACVSSGHYVANTGEHCQHTQESHGRETVLSEYQLSSITQKVWVLSFSNYPGEKANLTENRRRLRKHTVAKL